MTGASKFLKIPGQGDIEPAHIREMSRDEQQHIFPILPIAMEKVEIKMYVGNGEIVALLAGHQKLPQRTERVGVQKRETVARKWDVLGLIEDLATSFKKADV